MTKGFTILWQNCRMVEPWTRERRLEHTRSLLLDAAEEVFAEKGFMPATLDDIANAAGYYERRHLQVLRRPKKTSSWP